MPEGYHPDRSQVGGNTLMDYLRAGITEDILEVPGIGPASKIALESAGICTTYQLIGKYLSLKGPGVTPIEHADRFWYFLKSIGTANGSRGGVVRCIAEKVNILFPNTYCSEAYESIEDV